MLLRFQVEDLVSFVIKRANASNGKHITINYKEINSLHDKLRKKGIISDLGLREMRTMNYRYPNSIKLEECGLTIIKNNEFVEQIQYRVSEIDYDSEKLLADLTLEVK